MSILPSPQRVQGPMLRSPPPLAVIAVSAALALALPAAAQEIQLSGPLAGACIARLDRYAVPASVEWAYWLSAGTATRAASLSAGVGTELTTGVLEYLGFPAPRSPIRHGRRGRTAPSSAWARGRRP